MKKLIYFLLWAFISFANAHSQSFEYTYSPSGDRIHCQVILLKSQLSANDTTTTAPVETPLGEMSIKVFPNPTSGTLRIEITNLPESSSGNIRIFNLQGAEVISRNDISASILLDLSGLPAGDYIMRMEINNKFREWKIVKD